MLPFFSAQDAERYVVGRVCEQQSLEKSPDDVDVQWFSLMAGSRDLYQSVANGRQMKTCVFSYSLDCKQGSHSHGQLIYRLFSCSTEPGDALRLVFVTSFDAAAGIYKLRNILSEEIFSAPTQQPSRKDNPNEDGQELSKAELQRRAKAAERRAKAAAGKTRMVVSGFDDEYIDVVISLLKIQAGCTSKVEKVG